MVELGWKAGRVCRLVMDFGVREFPFDVTFGQDRALCTIIIALTSISPACRCVCSRDNLPVEVEPRIN